MIINAKHAYNISKDIIPKSDHGQCLYAIEELILKAALDGYTQCVYKVSDESSDVLNNITDTLTQNGYTWAYQYGPSMLLISWPEPYYEPSVYKPHSEFFKEISHVLVLPMTWKDMIIY